MPSSAPHSLRYALSLHDALPIFDRGKRCIPNAIRADIAHGGAVGVRACDLAAGYRPCGITDQLDLVDHRGGLAARAWSSTDDLCEDRKSTRLNSSHSQISYAVFCASLLEVRSFPTRRSSDLRPRETVHPECDPCGHRSWRCSRCSCLRSCSRVPPLRHHGSTGSG